MELLHNPAVWVLISFVIFAIIAYRYGRDAFLAKLDGRIAEIRTDIETAELLRVEAQELLAQYQRKQRDAEKEAEAIMANAKDHAERIRKQAEADLSDSMARREQQLEERLHRMEQAAKQQIQAYAAELAVKAAAGIIADHMDEKSAAKLIDQTIGDISKKMH
ncbi:MAG: hypothetical protein H6868_07080 [Rhodospirillales bacterium]|nr:hypothetical protein [Rhodospirillales bacterium]